MRPAPVTVRSAALLYSLAAAVVAPQPARAAATTVELPAGSVNGLAAAISQAGSGGTVVLKSGLHKESGSVVVTIPVSIAGEAGAILESATPAVFPSTFPITITAALQFKGAPGATVRGVWFQPPLGTVGCAAVLLEDSPGAQVLNNRMTQLQYGVVVQRGDNTVIRGNTINLATNWDLDPSDPAYLIDAVGVMVLAAPHAQVTGNQVSSAIMGIAASGAAAEVTGNTTTGNLMGIVLCSTPDGLYRFSGNSQTAGPPIAWYAHDNTVHNNLWGFMVTDRANNNLVVNNDASGNSVYDVELTGDTKRFAPLIPLAPAAYNNLVLAGPYKGLVIKDCGRDNQIVGEVKLVDHSVDPCN
jgi:parallel beta-helix repeat protein